MAILPVCCCAPNRRGAPRPTAPRCPPPAARSRRRAAGSEPPRRRDGRGASAAARPCGRRTGTRPAQRPSTLGDAECTKSATVSAELRFCRYLRALAIGPGRERQPRGQRACQVQPEGATVPTGGWPCCWQARPVVSDGQTQHSPADSRTHPDPPTVGVLDAVRDEFRHDQLGVLQCGGRRPPSWQARNQRRAWGGASVSAATR